MRLPKVKLTTRNGIPHTIEIDGFQIKVSDIEIECVAGHLSRVTISMEADVEIVREEPKS